MVLGFIAFWPIGLAILAYMIWGRKFGGGCSGRHRMNRMHRLHGFRSSGNTAFDAYKAETIRRLQDEQDAFEEFLKRLREAKDKTEFDQFMEDRARSARPTREPAATTAPRRDCHLRRAAPAGRPLHLLPATEDRQMTMIADLPSGLPDPVARGRVLRRRSDQAAGRVGRRRRAASCC